MCGCVLANKSFRLLFFSYKLKHHHSALYRIENRGFKSCHISHFFCLNTCVSCLFVCWYLCVYVCLWNRVLCCLFCICVGVFVRAKFWGEISVKLSPLKILNFFLEGARQNGLTVLRNLTLTVSHILLNSFITLSRCELRLKVSIKLSKGRNHFENSLENFKLKISRNCFFWFFFSLR